MSGARRALRQGACGLAALLMAACGGPESQIRFADPLEIPVPAGTLLEDVASAHRVDLQKLRDWNGMQVEAVPQDTVLLVWREPVRPASLADVTGAGTDAPSPEAVAADTPSAPRRAAPRPRPRSSAPKVVVDAPVLVVGGDGESPAKVTVAPPPEIGSVRSAGLLGTLSGMDDGELNDGLADSVAGLSGGGRAPGSAGLSKRGSGSLGGGGQAEGLSDIGRTPQTRVGPQVPNTPVRPPRLAMPPAKRCLAAPRADQLKGDDAMLASQGLTSAQIKRAMSGFVRHTTACIPKGTKGTYELQTEITVGCNGRVTNVWISNRGALPANVADCIAQTLKFAPFPAHAVPDGVSFAYPIQYRY